MVDLALKNLLHDRLRFVITVAGVAFAVALVLVQLGLFMGLFANATITIEKMSADLWVINKKVKNIDFGSRFPDSYVTRVRAVPGVAQADNMFVVFADVRLPGGNQEVVMLYGLDDFKSWGIPWSIESGDLEDLKRSPSFFIDASADRRWGSPIQVGEYREMLGRRVRIIGRTREAKSFTTQPLAFMDLHQVQELSPNFAGVTSYVVVRLEPGVPIASVRDELQRRLPNNEVLTREEWASRSMRYWVINTGLGFNLALTVFLGFLVGLVIVAQTLYAATMEHLREFGMVKAIGGGNWDIYKIIGRQALISAFLGFILGLIPSILARVLVARVGMKILMSPTLLLSVFAGTVVLCLSAAVISFRKVASLDPALVFRA